MLRHFARPSTSAGACLLRRSPANDVSASEYRIIHLQVHATVRRWFNMQEYQSKTLLDECGLNVQKFFIAETVDDVRSKIKTFGELNESYGHHLLYRRERVRREGANQGWRPRQGRVRAERLQGRRARDEGVGAGAFSSQSNLQ